MDFFLGLPVNLYKLLTKISLPLDDSRLEMRNQLFIGISQMKARFTVISELLVAKG